MNLGFTDRFGEYYLQTFFGKNAAAMKGDLPGNAGVSFGEIVSAKSAQADKVMANINHLPQWNGYPVPGRINSALIVLDENGEVARWNLISGGGISGPTKEEQRRFEEEQRDKKIRRARYMRIIEESAIKRKLQEMERNKMYYQESVKALPLSSVYEKRIREAQNIVRTNMMSGSAAGMMINCNSGAKG